MTALYCPLPSVQRQGNGKARSVQEISDMQEDDGRRATWTEHWRSTLQTTRGPCVDRLPHCQQAHTGAINPPSPGPPGAWKSRDAGTFINTNPDLPQAAGRLPMVFWDKTENDGHF